MKGLMHDSRWPRKSRIHVISLPFLAPPPTILFRNSLFFLQRGTHVALLTLLKNDSAAVDKLEIRQILALCGNGKLSDGSDCSKELREYLQIAKSENLFAYTDSCLSETFEKCGQVLQDIVNELGRRLDYTVENGLYQGKINASGNDGLWLDGDGHAIVVEVKTTDAYRINLDTVAAYQTSFAR